MIDLTPRKGVDTMNEADRQNHDAFEAAHKDDDQFIAELEALLSEPNSAPAADQPPEPETAKPQPPAPQKKKHRKMEASTLIKSAFIIIESIFSTNVLTALRLSLT